MGFLIFLGVCIGLALNFFVSNEFYKVAVMKGYDEGKYLWIPFFFGVAGYLLVVALPDRAARKENVSGVVNTKPVDEIPEL